MLQRTTEAKKTDHRNVEKLSCQPFFSPEEKNRQLPITMEEQESIPHHVKNYYDQPTLSSSYHARSIAQLVGGDRDTTATTIPPPHFFYHHETKELSPSCLKHQQQEERPPYRENKKKLDRKKNGRWCRDETETVLQLKQNSGPPQVPRRSRDDNSRSSTATGKGRGRGRQITKQNDVPITLSARSKALPLTPTSPILDRESRWLTNASKCTEAKSRRTNDTFHLRRDKSSSDDVERRTVRNLAAVATSRDIGIVDAAMIDAGSTLQSSNMTTRSSSPPQKPLRESVGTVVLDRMSSMITAIEDD